MAARGSHAQVFLRRGPVMTHPSEATGCPIVDFVYKPSEAHALDNFRYMDSLQNTAKPAVWTTESGGYWIFTDHQVVRDGLQRPDLWSSSAVVPTERNPSYTWIPMMLDPPAHTSWRRLLSKHFSPGRITSLLPRQRILAQSLLANLEERGHCEFVTDFARVFPAMVFLDLMGMPQNKLAEFLEWEASILLRTPARGTQCSSALPEAGENSALARMKGIQAVRDYFAELLTERRRTPLAGAQDIISAACEWRIGGQRVDDDDALNCLLLLFIAGLDTVASQISYGMLYLAQNNQDRRLVVENPDLAGQFVEEILRSYPIVQTARRATRDADFHGCAVEAGDIALFSLAAAGRDETAYHDARTVRFGRSEFRHVSFGAGPHRCIGSGLARQELAVMLTEWHRQIPDYELIGRPLEHGGGVWGLNSLELSWEK